MCVHAARAACCTQTIARDRTDLTAAATLKWNLAAKQWVRPMAFVQQKAQVWAKKAVGPSFDPHKAAWTVF